MHKSSKNKQGFTILELLIGLSIGIIVLTGLMSFFFRTSKMIGQEQDSVKNLSQLQFVMNKIVQDIKEANTVLPGAGTTMTATEWNALPHLPYGRTYLITITEPSESLERLVPAYPLAYNFPLFQAGKTGTSDGWYPKFDTTNELEALHHPESNQLAFYKVVRDKITRVLYYTEINSNDTNHPKSLLIKRRQQFANVASPFTLTNNFEDSNLQVIEDTILNNVKALQFTYPNLSKRLEPGSPDYDANLKTTLSGIATSDSYTQNKLMNQYRDTINIKIITSGKQISEYRATALELSTEVNIRD